MNLFLLRHRRCTVLMARQRPSLLRPWYHSAHPRRSKAVSPAHFRCQGPLIGWKLRLLGFSHRLTEI